MNEAVGDALTFLTIRGERFHPSSEIVAHHQGFLVRSSHWDLPVISIAARSKGKVAASRTSGTRGLVFGTLRTEHLTHLQCKSAVLVLFVPRKTFILLSSVFLLGQMTPLPSATSTESNASCIQRSDITRMAVDPGVLI